MLGQQCCREVLRDPPGAWSHDLLCDPYAVRLRSRKIQISSASRVATPFLEFSFQDGASARVMPLGLPFRSSQGRPDQRT